MTATTLERLLKQDRALILGAVSTVVLVAALYTVLGVGMNMSAIEMTRMARPVGHPMDMMLMSVWTLSHAVLIFLMWWIMMIAMMTPSASPAILLFAALKRSSGMGAVIGSAWFFLSGYLLIWAGFSAIAVVLQWSLGTFGVLQPAMMTLSSPVAAGAVLIVAGIYQFTPLKQACLRQCQSPAEFLVRHNRRGLRGAVVMGMRHGAYCLGCCWALMALLFVGGIMNLFWIAALALIVAAEKLLPASRWASRGIGVVLILWGAAVAM